MMKASYKLLAGVILAFAFGALSVGEAVAQFTTTWLDIGDYQDSYTQVGVRNEVSSLGAPMSYPAIMRGSEHERAGAFWIGAKDWTDADGLNYPYYTSRIGPREPGVEFAFPVEDKLLSKWEDSDVTVDGVASFDRVAVVNEVDPNLPADRVQESVWNMSIGITARKRAYAWSNPFHDEYHIVEYVFTNTGNTDDDPEIELPDQTLSETYFYWIHRWRGTDNGAWIGDGGQVWGKYSMVDAVGDGHADYPLDITAYYLWKGYEPDYAASNWDNLGAPILEAHWSQATGDTVGRLYGAFFDGEMPLYAPNSTSDPTFDRMVQPHTIGFMDQDEKLTAAGAAHVEYYEDGILTREDDTPAPEGCSTDVPRTRMCPMWADRIEPDGNFWEPSNNPSQGRQGGHAPTVAYGPYDMAFGDEVRIVFVRSVGGLDFDAALTVGREFKLTAPAQRDDHVIRYDANGDGVIKDDVEYAFHDVYDLGLEAMTKNQWSLTARDSLFKNFLKGRAVYEAMNDFTTYPIAQPPLPPQRFAVNGRPGQIELSWEPLAGGPSRVGWEVYRTERNVWWSPAYDYVREASDLMGALNSLDDEANMGRLRRREDEMPYTCLRGMRPDCEGPALDAGATAFNDETAVRGTDYYYYLVAVGEELPNDEYQGLGFGLSGVPGGGVRLRSSRYFTQTYQPANLKRPPFGETGTIADVRVVPNPVNLGSDQSIRFTKEDEVAFFNIPGECTIRIYSEIGELIETIEHTDGSGDEKWDLTTRARQLLVSGIYIAVVETPEGERVFRKFTVIR